MSTAAIVTVVGIVAFVVLMASLFFAEGHPASGAARH